MLNKILVTLKNYQVRCEFTYTGEDNYTKVGTLEAHNPSEAIDAFLDKVIDSFDKRTLPDTFRMLKVTVQEV